MPVATRPEQDPAGKAVDLIPWPARLSVIALRCVSDDPRRAILSAVLAEFDALRDKPAKRRNNRDYVVWIGSFYHPEAGHFDAVGFPDRFDSDVHIRLHRRLTSISTYTELTTLDPQDMSAVPLVRWSYGSVILYKSPFEPDGSDTSSTVEIRSFEITRDYVARRRVPLPRISLAEVNRFDLDAWSTASRAIVEVAERMREPTSYSSLRKLAAQCGISVRLRNELSFPANGNLQLLDFDGSTCQLRIDLRADLDKDLKYAVLSHELGHFVNHFPIMFLRCHAEVLSWEFPEFTNYFAGRLLNFCTPTELEADANYFGSYFLVPPWIDEANFNMMYERGSSPSKQEMIWRFLQPLFPHSKGARYSWTNLSQMKDIADREVRTSLDSITDGDDTIFNVVLASAINRNTRDATSLRQRILEGVSGLDEAIDDMVRALTNMSIHAGRAMLAQSDVDSFSRAKDHLLAIGAVHDPVSPQLEQLAMRIPLVPAGGSEGSNNADSWRAPIDGRGYTKSLNEWRHMFAAHSIVTYAAELFSGRLFTERT